MGFDCSLTWWDQLKHLTQVLFLFWFWLPLLKSRDLLEVSDPKEESYSLVEEEEEEVAMRAAGPDLVYILASPTEPD